MRIAITNNPMVRGTLQGQEPAVKPGHIKRSGEGAPPVAEFHDTDCLGVFFAVRDRIHLGHSLLTHPLSGSVKPWETPYKTVIITGEKGVLDENSLSIIEESIQACVKLQASAVKKVWSAEMLADFQFIDFHLIFG